jgi:hypothetical protein
MYRTSLSGRNVRTTEKYATYLQQEGGNRLFLQQLVCLLYL